MANSVSNVLNFGVATVPGIETLKCDRSKHHEQECFYFGTKCFSCGKKQPGTKLKAMRGGNTVLLLRIRQRVIERSLPWNTSVLDPLIS